MFHLRNLGLQNDTIEERVALLEIQVVEIEEDVTGLNEDVIGLRVDRTELEGDVNFLFDEQVIQDERLFSLEQTSNDFDDQLDLINGEMVSNAVEMESLILFFSETQHVCFPSDNSED